MIFRFVVIQHFEAVAQSKTGQSPQYKLLSQPAQVGIQKYPMITFLSSQIHVTSQEQTLHVFKGKSLVYSLPQFYPCK